VVGAARDQDVIRRAEGTVAPVPTGERRWSTPEMLAAEARLVASALDRQEAGVAVVPPDALEDSLRAGLRRLPSLGTDQANHLYYMGEPPPDEDHHVVEVTQPGLESLVAATERSRAQVMALDLLQEPASETAMAAEPAPGWSQAPMTEAQAATLARCGEPTDRALTWVQASLLIDAATGTSAGLGPRGGCARTARARRRWRARSSRRSAPCERRLATTYATGGVRPARHGRRRHVASPSRHPASPSRRPPAAGPHDWAPRAISHYHYD
jgi:hypothetical protein